MDTPLLDLDDLMADLPVLASDLLFTRHMVEGSELYCEEAVPAVQERLDAIMARETRVTIVEPTREGQTREGQTRETQTRETTDPTLVSFTRATKHCSRLSRSLMLGGVSLLMGPRGSGRKVLAQTTATAHNYCFR